MQRQARLSLAATLVFGSAGALAQDGDLARVTMRVLDDISDVDAVVLELDANRGEAEDGAAGDDGADRGAAAADEERSRDAASRDDAAEAAAEDARRAERRERDDLLDTDRDERSEGRLEDRDVERPAVPPTTPVP
jgi:hypothetical protein